VILAMMGLPDLSDSLAGDRLCGKCLKCSYPMPRPWTILLDTSSKALYLLSASANLALLSPVILIRLARN
jgi:hypothetical protein